MAARQKVTSGEEMEKVLKSMKKGETVAFLKGHHLLKACSKSSKDSLPKVGDIVWARAFGSVYWPGFVPALTDIEGVEPEEDVDDSAYTFVMFLEEHFRYAPVPLENVIPAKDLDIQKVLVNHYNRLVLKTTKGPASFTRKALELLDLFLPMPPLERQKRAESTFSELVTTKKRVSNAGDNPSEKGPAEVEEETPKGNLKAQYKEKINQMVSATKKRKKNGLRVSERIVTKQVVQLKSESKAATAKKKTEKKAEEKSAKAKPVNKNARPDVGGEVMRDWTKARFDKISKQYSFESTSPAVCVTCDKPIENQEEVRFCHGLPHHTACTQLIDARMEPHIRKCSMCIAQQCFLCRKPSEGDKIAFKCSRCDLRFHIDCLLKDWPQAEIQGSNGPITCPTHFCHTCLGEQKTNGKFRDFTTNPSKAYHCLYCLSTYHKSCLPAGCGEDIKGKEYIICPKHKLPDLKVTQRRIGCLTCYKSMKGKEKERVECQFCIQSFHPECVGYTGEIKERISLEDFGSGYKCFSCRWGLFPLYGQVVWFQQPASQYWPARILFPSEAKTRAAFAKRLPGQYSVEYFGTNSFYDNASRGVPLHLTTVEIFQSMKVYQDTPKILRAHEEASFFLQFFEGNRDKALPLPRPVYKKIERNVYRTMSVTKTKEHADVCSCSEDGKAEFVCVPDSGCTNRDMEMECSDRICKGGKRCSNRMFVERKNDDEFLEQKLFRSKGWGVIAKKAFQPGDFVAEYRGEVIDRNEMLWRLSKKEEEDPMYILEISKEFFIDAEYIGNLSRLINHSCDPNCEIRKYLSLGRSVGGIFAKRQIEAGEEVTFDYGCGSQSTAPFRCRCGAENCVVFVGKEVPEGFQVEEELELDGTWDDVCSKCSFGGRLICCEFPGCDKVYHYQCAGLSRPPRFFSCADHPSNSKVLREALKKKSAETLRGRRKLSNGSSSISSKSRNSSSASSVSSDVAPKRKSKSLNAQSTSALVRKSSQKLNTLVEVDPSPPRSQKRKSRSEHSDDLSLQPAQKKLKTSVGNRKSENSPQESVTTQVDNEAVATTTKSERRLRSSTSGKNIAAPEESGKNDNEPVSGSDPVYVVIPLESKMLPPLNSGRFRGPKTPGCGTRWRSSSSASVIGAFPSSSATRATRKRRAQSCSPSCDNRVVTRRNGLLSPESSTETTIPEDSAMSMAAQGDQAVNGTGGGNRRKLRGQGANKSSEPFSPLALNTYVPGCVQEPAADGDDDKQALLRMGVLTRSSTGSFIESQAFPQNGLPPAMSNGPLSNHTEEDLSEMNEEMSLEPFEGEQHCSIEMSLPIGARRKRPCVHAFESNGLDSTTTAEKFHFDQSESENATSALECLEYRRLPRRHSQQYSVEK